jgi:peroxiredoxin Q/BCP
MALEIGTKAPEFTAETDGDGKISLSDLKGKWVVLYFYPKDNTSGCTKEACGFRDNMERITSAGAEVIGVSPDSVKSHNNFKEKHELNFRLIADPEKEICNLYDIIGEKKMYGKSYLGVIRTTYIINPEGEIAEAWSKVKVAGHVDKVIEKLEELQKN